MMKHSQKINLLELSEQTPTSKGSKFFSNLHKNSSFSKENNLNINNIIPKKKVKYINIKQIHNHEGTTTHDDTNSKFSNSQNVLKKKKRLIKSASCKNRKREREKIIKLLRNNEKIKIPIGKRNSNGDNKINLNINNTDNIIKKNSETKERNDSFGNKITKENKKNVHICFKDLINKKKFIEFIPIESFKSFNIIEENKNKTTQPYCTRCCSIF